LADGLLPVGVGTPVQPGGDPFPDPSFGKPRTAFNPRQLQFSVKFSF
jgi:hypothetical protein